MVNSISAPRRCALRAEVAACEPICAEHVRIEIVADGFSRAEPGQFVQLLCREPHDDADVVREWRADQHPSLSAPTVIAPEPFLRRPFSIGDQWFDSRGAAHLIVISHAVGIGTRWLARIAPGRQLDITGPLGTGFALPGAETPVILVGGGVGIPPLLFLARRLREFRHRHVSIVLGARSSGLLPVRLDAPPSPTAATACVAYPGEARYPTLVATDDGSLGLRGTVIDALSRVDAISSLRQGGEPTPVVFACGPEGMLRAVARYTREIGARCQLCIERNMGCGLGTCLSCVVRTRDAGQPSGWRWRLACQDGPVFDRDVLLDYG